jgi:hypothetical protein
VRVFDIEYALGQPLAEQACLALTYLEPKHQDDAAKAPPTLPEGQGWRLDPSQLHGNPS